MEAERLVGHQQNVMGRICGKGGLWYMVCGAQNHVQVVYIDVPNPHWTCTTVLG